MDVDPIHNPSLGFSEAGCAGLPRIDENCVFDSKTAKQKFIEMLDIMEGHVEKLRKDAIQLEEDRDALLSSLDSIRNANMIVELADHERDDVLHFTDRVINRCLTIELKIHTQRDKPQEEALHQINHLIDSLVVGMKSDPESTQLKCVSYMNSCSSHTVQGVIDKNFESILLGCTVDDQKRVKKRLQGLLNYMTKFNVSSDVD